MAGALVAATIAIFGVWGPAVPAFGGTVETPYTHCTYCPAILSVSFDLRASIPVSVNWVDVSGGEVTFTVLSPYTQSVCKETGSSGVDAFYSFGGNYTFMAVTIGNESVQQVDFTGFYVR